MLTHHASTCDIDTANVKDIFDVVDALHHASKMPSTSQFEQFAQELHSRYTTEASIFRTANGMQRSHVFLGTPWKPFRDAEEQPERPGVGGLQSKILEEVDRMDEDEPFTGDLVLARSQDLMREVIRSREAVWSSAEGDVGRVWAQMKAMLIAFAGSSHKKYAQYLLETLIDLELESTPQLREALLSTGVATVSGLAGSFKPTDLLQEYFQRILEAIVQHKGAEFGARFIREGIARNIAHFQRLKEEFLGGVGLEKHSQRHSKPSANAEMHILLKEYRETELHLLRAGRRFNNSTTFESQFAIGVRNLNSGLLSKWTTRMVLLREQDSSAPRPHTHLSEQPSPHLQTSNDIMFEDPDDVDIMDTLDQPLYAHSVTSDGQIVTHSLDPESDARSVIAIMESQQDVTEDSDETDPEFDDIPSQRCVDVQDGFETDEETGTWESAGL